MIFNNLGVVAVGFTRGEELSRLATGIQKAASRSSRSAVASKKKKSSDARWRYSVKNPCRFRDNNLMQKLIRTHMPLGSERVTSHLASERKHR